MNDPTSVPSPWTWDVQPLFVLIHDADSCCVCLVPIDSEDGEEEKRIADLICRSVNAHEQAVQEGGAA